MQPGNPPDENADRASSSRVVPVNCQRLTVLVVEDHPAYRTLLGWILHKLALGFVVVDDGQAGLAVMERQRIDLVLTDCQMPVMDGYAMTRQVRRNERLAGTARVPIIAFTATLGPEQIQRCVAAGIDAWLLKPVTFEQLRDVLTNWIPLSVRPYRPEAAPQWPTRASLLETFGSVTTVEQLLQTLVREAQVDLAVLTEAQRTRDACATAQHLHRLIGSVAFLGADSLETRGALGFGQHGEVRLPDEADGAVHNGGSTILAAPRIGMRRNLSRAAIEGNATITTIGASRKRRQKRYLNM